jgi:hypothetical protein
MGIPIPAEPPDPNIDNPTIPPTPQPSVMHEDSM